MGWTSRDYPVAEIALSLEYGGVLASGHERKIVGDIIAIRKPSAGIGMAEMKRFLWLRVEGLEENEFGTLTMLESEEGGPGEDLTSYDKRRYCIPLERLKALYPDFDINRALDSDDIYQPFLPVDEDGPALYLTSSVVAPLSVEGLVFDKRTRTYL